jgi:hypothetical protein
MTAHEKEDRERSSAAAEASDWESRRLCSDENCIGVIGPDGRCKECGKPYAGGPAVEARRPEPALPVEAAGLPTDPAEAAGTDDEWESRRLCRDENCIGVIGPDGRCKECGKAYE